MFATALTLIGLLADVSGFALAWHEYLSASRDAEDEVRASQEELKTQLAGVDPIAFRQGVTETIRNRDGTITRNSYQSPIGKSWEKISKEERDIAKRQSELRAERYVIFTDSLLRRRKTFTIGAWLVFVGFLFQAVGALLSWG